jgi:hypothetical protein
MGEATVANPSAPVKRGRKLAVERKRTTEPATRAVARQARSWAGLVVGIEKRIRKAAGTNTANPMAIGKKSLDASRNRLQPGKCPNIQS